MTTFVFSPVVLTSLIKPKQKAKVGFESSSYQVGLTQDEHWL